MSKDHGYYREAEARQKEKDFLESRKRPCHDCKKPTWDYRCPACQAKWRNKYGVSPMINDAEE